METEGNGSKAHETRKGAQCWGKATFALVEMQPAVAYRYENQAPQGRGYNEAIQHRKTEEREEAPAALRVARLAARS